MVKRVDQDDALYRKMLLTPALKSQEYSQKETYKRLEQFLFNIFDQPLEQAYRRNRELWGKHYYEKRLNQRNYEHMAGRVKKLIPRPVLKLLHR